MSVSKLQDLFKAVESGDYVETCLFDELQNAIKSKVWNILQIVENLGILLIHKETPLRKKGTEILSKCLGMLEKDFLTSKELEFLAAFYCDRLKDHHSIVPEILLGLYHLCDMNHLPQNSYIQLFPVVFLQFSCQSQMIQDRKMFFDILYKCMLHNIEALKPMGPDFVCGVIQSIDGERDPRNLLFLFTSLIPLFFRHFDLYHLTEEMFDIMACYFPVDFRPKENDPDAISREDLSNALMPNLTAKAAFAEFCFPLALEKLDSDLKVAKLDSLVLLTNACYKFPQEKISENFKNIWNVIKRDLNSNDTEIKQKVLQLLHAMLTILPDENARSSFHSIYDYVKYSFTTNLDKALFVSNVKMLTNVGKDSRVCMREIAVLLVPLLFSEINKTYNDEYIEVLNEILEICTHNLDINLSKLNELSVAWDDLLLLFLKLCPTSTPSMQGLTILHSFLDVDQRKSLYKILYDALKSKTFSDEFEASLCKFAKNYKDEVSKHVIVPFQNEIIEKAQEGPNYPNVNNIENEVLENLKQNDPTVYTKDENEDGFMKPVAYRRNEDNEEIPIFLAICPPAPVTPVEENFIKNVFCPLISLDIYMKDLSRDVMKFCLLEDPDESSCFRFSKQDPTTNIAYLKFVFQKYESKSDVLINYLESEFQISERVMNMYVNNTSNNEQYSVPFVLDCIAVLNIILNASDKTSLNDANTTVQAKIFKLLENISGTSEKGVGYIVLIPLMNKIDFMLLENNDNLATRIGLLVSRLFEIASTTNDTFVNKQLSILLSVIFNNIDNLDSNKFDINVDLFQTKLQSLSYDNNVCTLHAYMTKSLLMKGYKGVDAWLQILIVNLKNNQVGKNVVESIKLIIKQDTLSEDYFEFKNVRFLYRQRLFGFTLGKIMKTISDLNGLDSENTSIDSKVLKLNNYLALLVQLKYLPSQILVSHMKTLLPIMIECLALICDTQLRERLSTEMDTSEDTEIVDSPKQLTPYFTHFNFDDALQTLLALFKEFLVTKLEILEEYINSFIERFLFVARYHSSLHHRESALECLYHLSYFNVIKLVPFKNKVIEELKHCLDDRKRLVRRQAVVTIDRWYILDSEVNE